MMPTRRRFSVGMPERDRPSRRRRLVLGGLFVLAVVVLARLMLWVGRVPAERVPPERVIEVR